MGAHYYRCAPIFALLQKRTQCGEQQAADNQNDCTAKSRRNLGEGHQFHAVSRGKDCHIAGTAHVCHTETCGDTGLHRIESDPLANDGRTEERADTGDKAQNEVRQAEALNNRIKAQVAQTCRPAAWWSGSSSRTGTTGSRPPQYSLAGGCRSCRWPQ